ncbi:MAG TPA: DUF3301 domain-containing protein [Steroidobacteraceae bacterium]|nr:DUF3301 domain-containing protein [Steroidobacteraceae bacterium]
MSADLLLLLAACGLAACYLLWQRALAARETANRFAHETCSRAVVQLLDGTVAFSGLRLTRAANGSWRLLRIYTFDYSGDGVERAQGFVVLAGTRLEAVGLAGCAS